MRKRYLIGYLIGQRIRSKDREDLRRKGKSLTPQERCQTEPRNWREVIFWFELSARRSLRERESEGACREPRTPPGPAGPACPRIALGSRRGRDQPRRLRERTACGRALRASLGASRRDESLIAVGTQKPTFICPTGRASVRGGRGGMSTASASATDVGRVRPTEKYWTDYEDWKVRPPTRSRRLDTSVRPERTKKPAVSGAAVVLIISRPEVSWKNVLFLFLKDRLTAFRAPHAASHTSVCRHS